MGRASPLYGPSAAALGAGWFVVLSVPGVTRGFLLDSPARNLLCLVVASVLVAYGCRPFIAGAETFSEHLARGVLIPYAGCLVFLTLVAALMWSRTLLFGGLANLHDTLSLYVMGLTAAATSVLVVIPYGLLCQYLMSGLAARRTRPD